VAASTQDRVQGELAENIVAIRRCATVVKGGRRFSFAAMVVVGDGKGKVGWGYGKANEVPPSVEKARKEAMRKHGATLGVVYRNAILKRQRKNRPRTAQDGR